MTRAFWVEPLGDHEAVAGAALEAGADGVLADPGTVEAVEGVGRLPIATADGQTVTFPEATGHRVRIDEPGDQDQARTLLDKVDVLVVATEDWSIIPLENLIAWSQESPTRLYALVEDTEAAEVALTTLETGVEGIVLATDDPATVHDVGSLVSKGEGGRVDLAEAEVVSVDEAGLGDRVCVDTTSLLEPDEGLLVGSTSGLLALVASEASEAGYVASRPFRVNAGAVHAYVMAPGDETRYLSEVRAGVPLLAVNRSGATRRVVTGRAKIERRPMLLVRVRAGDREGTLVLQNAETIRLVTPDGLVSVSDLTEDDTVLVHAAHAGGRHFGTAIEETIDER